MTHDDRHRVCSRDPIDAAAGGRGRMRPSRMCVVAWECCVRVCVRACAWCPSRSQTDPRRWNETSGMTSVQRHGRTNEERRTGEEGSETTTTTKSRPPRRVCCCCFVLISIVISTSTDCVCCANGGRSCGTTCDSRAASAPSAGPSLQSSR